MRVPDSLESLMTEGIITEVVRPLMSGKEAQVYLVESGGELRVAKIYKDAIHRSFKHRAEYTEGRGVRSSRDARAMQKRSKYGRAMDEEAWRAAEVDIIHRLRDAGVRVPEPFQFVDGVLIMELVKDAEGAPAPRLGDVSLSAEEARKCFDHLLAEVVKMVCAGVVHGDLSDFNVLMSARGPVIIDFPQSVDPSKNQNARELLIRDVDNLTHFLSQHEPAMKGRPYGQEIWEAYEHTTLTPDFVPTGTWRPAERLVDTQAVLHELAAVEKEENFRRAAKGLPPRPGQGSGSGQAQGQGQRSGHRGPRPRARPWRPRTGPAGVSGPRKARRPQVRARTVSGPPMGSTRRGDAPSTIARRRGSDLHPARRAATPHPRGAPSARRPRRACGARPALATRLASATTTAPRPRPIAAVAPTIATRPTTGTQRAAPDPRRARARPPRWPQLSRHAPRSRPPHRARTARRDRRGGPNYRDTPPDRGHRAAPAPAPDRRGGPNYRDTPPDRDHRAAPAPRSARRPELSRHAPRPGTHAARRRRPSRAAHPTIATRLETAGPHRAPTDHRPVATAPTTAKAPAPARPRTRGTPRAVSGRARRGGRPPPPPSPDVTAARGRTARSGAAAGARRAAGVAAEGGSPAAGHPRGLTL
jgi:RIO kinase 1